MTQQPNPIRTLTISFNLPLQTYQIPNWRGAFVQMGDCWDNEIFHNHNNSSQSATELITDNRQPSTVHYRYPKIQYRTRHGNASLFAINEGIEAIQKVLAQSDWQLQWQGESKTLQVEDLRMNEHYLRFLPEMKPYKTFRWLAFNEKNYREYQKTNGLIPRIRLLERILKGHILTMLWGIGWDFDQQLEVQIDQINRSQTIRLHETKLMAFDLDFSCNVLLPEGVGIGKSVSRGFGIQVPMRKHTKQPFETKKLIMNYKL